ncbi:MAG: hypothetical protein AB7D43_00230 [Sulfurimonadaceae bacterium]|jgi:hypothetical protein
MQTIHIDVQDGYVAKVVTMLETLRGVMLEDIKVEKKSTPFTSPKELVDAQQIVMQSTWDNDADKAWDAV